MTRPSKRHIAGVVLCGGDGRRVGGQDKPLLPLAGRPLVEHVLERVVPQVGEVLISANRNLVGYRAMGVAVVEDPASDQGIRQGPLAGVLAAARRSRLPLLFACPGDSPLLGVDLVVTLAGGLEAGVDAVVPHDGQRLQPLFLLVRRDAALTIESYLDAGGRSVRGWLAGQQVATVPIACGGQFLNVNTLEQLAELEAQQR